MATAEQVINNLFMWNQSLLYFCAILGVLLVIIAVKTPAITFLKGFFTGKPIAAIRRKDGKYDFNIGKYSEGIIWHKYGFHQIDPEAITRERKSGCDFHLGLDSIGITLSDKMMQILRVFRDKYKFKNIDEIKAGLEAWRKCNKEECGFEGIPEVRVTEETSTGKKGPLVKKTYEYKCPKCEGTSFTKTFPELKFPTYNVFDPGFIDNYFQYNMNPSANEVITMREVQNQLDAEKKKEPLQYIGIGIMICMICVGIAVLFIILGKMDIIATGEAVAKTASTVKVPGLTG